MQEFLEMKNKMKQLNLLKVWPAGGLTLQKGTMPSDFKTSSVRVPSDGMPISRCIHVPADGNISSFLIFLILTSETQGKYVGLKSSEALICFKINGWGTGETRLALCLYLLRLGDR